MKNFRRPVPLLEIAPRLAVLALPALLVLLVRLALLAVCSSPCSAGASSTPSSLFDWLIHAIFSASDNAAKGAVAELINHLCCSTIKDEAFFGGRAASTDCLAAALTASLSEAARLRCSGDAFFVALAAR